MSIVYKPDIGTVISLNTGQVITGATALTIEVKKPSGTVASWPCTIGVDTKSVEHTVVANDIDELGSYLLQSKLTLAGGTWRGATVVLEIKDIFR